MQDFTDDVAPYVMGFYKRTASYYADYKDSCIMLARMKAAARGARPIDIERNVQTLGGE